MPLTITQIQSPTYATYSIAPFVNTTNLSSGTSPNTPYYYNTYSYSGDPSPQSISDTIGPSITNYTRTSGPNTAMQTLLTNTSSTSLTFTSNILGSTTSPSIDLTGLTIVWTGVPNGITFTDGTDATYAIMVITFVNGISGLNPDSGYITLSDGSSFNFDGSTNTSVNWSSTSGSPASLTFTLTSVATGYATDNAVDISNLTMAGGTLPYDGNAYNDGTNGSSFTAGVNSTAATFVFTPQASSPFLHTYIYPDAGDWSPDAGATIFSVTSTTPVSGSDWTISQTFLNACSTQTSITMTYYTTGSGVTDPTSDLTSSLSSGASLTASNVGERLWQVNSTSSFTNGVDSVWTIRVQGNQGQWNLQDASDMTTQSVNWNAIITTSTPPASLFDCLTDSAVTGMPPNYYFSSLTVNNPVTSSDKTYTITMDSNWTGNDGDSQTIYGSAGSLSSSSGTTFLLMMCGK